MAHASRRLELEDLRLVAMKYPSVLCKSSHQTPKMSSPSKRYTLYTSPSLPCPQRVHIAIHELGISGLFSVVEIDVKNKPVSFLALSSSGAVPILIDHAHDGKNDLIVTESRAICRYLVLSHAEVSASQALIPAGLNSLYRHAMFEEAASLEAMRFDSVANKLVFERRFKGYLDIGPGDTDVVEDLQGQLEEVLDLLERVLTVRNFMAGKVNANGPKLSVTDSA